MCGAGAAFWAVFLNPRATRRHECLDLANFRPAHAVELSDFDDPDAAGLHC